MWLCHRCQSFYSIVTVHGNGYDWKTNSKVETVGVLGERMFSSLPVRGPGEHCKLTQWARATWRFRTFYRLTKLLLVSILLMLNLFQWNFRGVRAIEELHNQIFVVVLTPTENLCFDPGTHKRLLSVEPWWPLGLIDWVGFNVPLNTL